MSEYCMYLRKSRADLDAEARGEGETLARHRAALFSLARRQGLNITEVYSEVVSGESIAARPVMQQLLLEVGQGRWAGVLVMEVERLARGDTVDQGIVAQTFKFSGTNIITPMKTYNPANEFDEEYFEFGLFMSRREYKTINRRLQQGRIASAREGKYVSNKAPYGYERKKLEKEKGFTLEIIPEEAEVVSMIFEFYTIGELMPDGSRQRIGVARIARRLNDLKIPTKGGGEWTPPTLQDMLANPVYIGKIRWNWRAEAKQMENGQVSVTRPRSKDVLLFDGLHEPIISAETFELAQQIRSKNPPRPINEHLTVKNPLGGLIICSCCGRRMVRRPYAKNKQADTLICPYPQCPNVSSRLSIVEERLLEGLEEWLRDYKLQWSQNEPAPQNRLIDIKRKALIKIEDELEKLQTQRGKLHDLLEQGVYDTETFLFRSRDIGERISQANNNHSAIQAEIQLHEVGEMARHNIIPKVEHLLAVYDTLPDAAAKNDLLKEVIERAVYTKETGTRWHGSPYDFILTLYPKIPAPYNDSM